MHADDGVILVAESNEFDKYLIPSKENDFGGYTVPAVMIGISVNVTRYCHCSLVERDDDDDDYCSI